MKIVLSKITKAQVIAALGFAGDEAVAYGLLPHSTEQLLVGVAGIVLPGVLMIADAIVHHAFAKIRVAELEAEAAHAIALLQHPRSAPAAPASTTAKKPIAQKSATK